MDLESYEYVSGKTLFDFNFESVGPNGKITKSIRYSLENASGHTYFNIGFGDLNAETGEIDDLSISNNYDTYKILLTISKNILEFTARFPDMLYHFKGSTISRTRLYQIAATKNIDLISELFDLYGWYNGQWEMFILGKNYEAFLFHRKPNQNL